MAGWREEIFRWSKIAAALVKTEKKRREGEG